MRCSVTWVFCCCSGCGELSPAALQQESQADVECGGCLGWFRGFFCHHSGTVHRQEKVVMGRVSDQTRQSSRAPGVANQWALGRHGSPLLTNACPNTLLNKNAPTAKNRGQSPPHCHEWPGNPANSGRNRLFTRNGIMHMPSGGGRLPLMSPVSRADSLGRLSPTPPGPGSSGLSDRYHR